MPATTGSTPTALLDSSHDHEILFGQQEAGKHDKDLRQFLAVAFAVIGKHAGQAVVDDPVDGIE